MGSRQWAAGDVLAEKYQLTQELGRGGMGAVWRADHLVLRSPVAVKLVLARVADSEALRARFLREAQASAALRSPHVVQILDYGVHEDTPFMVMELLEGESLRTRLQRQRILSPVETARILVHVARALEKAREAGIVHRDLKPDNVFIVHNADDEIVKVLDFGIAKAIGLAEGGVDTGTQTGAVLGTPHYMSPEQARGTRAVDHRSDLWALAVIAFECLTGRRPFDSAVLGDLLVKICTDPAPVPSTVAPVPPGFDAWFQRAVERDPDRRFGTALEMAEAFRALIGAGLPSMPPPSMPLPSYAAATSHIGALPSSPISVSPAVTHGPVSLTPAPKRASPLVVPLVILLGLGAAAALGAAGYLYAARSSTPVAGSASGVPTLDTPVSAAGVGLLDSTDGGVTPLRATSGSTPGAAPAAGPAGTEPTTKVKPSTDVEKALSDAEKAQADAKKAQESAKKTQESAEKTRAAAEAMKLKYGGTK